MSKIHISIMCDDVRKIGLNAIGICESMIYAADGDESLYAISEVLFVLSERLQFAQNEYRECRKELIAKRILSPRAEVYRIEYTPPVDDQ